jgi:alpha-1,2-mannosyltransferase
VRALLLVIGAAWVVLNGANALHKGGDFSVYLDAGTRLLHGKPLYEASGIAAGLVGPPFQPVLFVPFALLATSSVEVARIAWHLFNVLCLGVGLYAWHLALTPARPPLAVHSPSTFVWPLLAVMYPLQTNFEHQNINAVLLAFAGLGALRESEGRNRAAGLWLGAAAALKVFPLLLLGVLAVRRCWRTLGWACAAAVVLTVLPLLRYGAAGYIDLMHDWWSFSGQGHWPIRRHNQSLFAMLGRYLSPADLLTWGPIPETASPGVHLVWLVTAVAVTALFLWMVARATRPARRETTTVALAAGLCLAVLLSPIAWEHYWLLLWPVFAIAYNPPAGSPSWVRVAFWTGAVLTSGIARPTVGRTGVAIARGLSIRTWAGAVMLVASLAVLRTLQRGTDYHVRTT